MTVELAKFEQMVEELVREERVADEAIGTKVRKRTRAREDAWKEYTRRTYKCKRICMHCGFEIFGTLEGTNDAWNDHYITCSPPCSPMRRRLG